MVGSFQNGLNAAHIEKSSVNATYIKSEDLYLSETNFTFKGGSIMINPMVIYCQVGQLCHVTK